MPLPLSPSTIERIRTQRQYVRVNGAALRARGSLLWNVAGRRAQTGKRPTSVTLGQWTGSVYQGTELVSGSGQQEVFVTTDTWYGIGEQNQAVQFLEGDIFTSVAEPTLKFVCTAIDHDSSARVDVLTLEESGSAKTT